MILFMALVAGIMLPRGVKSQTKARKDKIAKTADRFGITVFSDSDR